jgi:hypothetical protein
VRGQGRVQGSEPRLAGRGIGNLVVDVLVVNNRAFFPFSNLFRSQKIRNQKNNCGVFPFFIYFRCTFFTWKKYMLKEVINPPLTHTHTQQHTTHNHTHTHKLHTHTHTPHTPHTHPSRDGGDWGRCRVDTSCVLEKPTTFLDSTTGSLEDTFYDLYHYVVLPWSGRYKVAGGNVFWKYFALSRLLRAISCGISPKGRIVAFLLQHEISSGFSTEIMRTISCGTIAFLLAHASGTKFRLDPDWRVFFKI